MAATESNRRIRGRLRPFGTAQRAPMAKRSESPGRIGVTTSPVSQKMMRKRIA
jgi:hypothetical protein